MKFVRQATKRFSAFRKLRQWLALSAVVMLVMLVPLVIWQLADPQQSEAAWFDDGFTFRKAITFTHNAALSDRRVTVTLDTAALTTNKMQSDCDDLRFTDPAGNLLDYQLVSGCDTASTSVDVVLPTVHNGVNLLYIYYGNPSASSASKNISGYTSLSPSGGAASLATEETTPGPVAYWKFDEGTSNTCPGGVNDACDSSPNLHNGAFSGTAPAWRPESDCVSGSCLFFAGTSNRSVSVADSDYLDFGTGSFTVQAWVKKGFMDLQDVIVQKNVNGAEGGFGLLMRSDGAFRFGIDDDGTSFPEDNATSTTVYNDNRWHHVVGVKNGTSNIRLYVDGVLVASDTSLSASGSLTSAGPLFIGMNPDGSSQEWEDGFIDEVKIYPYARSATEIIAEYAMTSARMGQRSSAAFLNSGLVGYWNLDESAANSCSGGTNDACDLSGYGYDGAWQGNATVTNTAKFNRAVTFDGTGDYISVADNATLDLTNSVTMASWVKASDLSGYKRIMAKTSGTETTGYMLDVVAGLSMLRMRINSNDCNSASNVIVTGRWYHVAATYDRKAMNIYLNGELIKTCPLTEAITTNTDVLAIGNRSDDNAPWNGQMDDVRLFNRALSGSEVAALAAWGPAPVGYWNFEEKTGQTVFSRGSVLLSSRLGASTSTEAVDPTWVTGKEGGGLQFDGVNDYVLATYDQALSLSDNLTLEAWVKPNNVTTAWQGVLNKGTPTNWNNRAYGLFVDMDEVALSYRNANGWQEFRTTSANLVANQWSHIVYTRDGTTEKIIVNGKLEASGSVTQTMLNDTYDLSIGAVTAGADNTEKFGGVVDEVKIYNYARTLTQVNLDVQDKAGPDSSNQKLPDPVAHYKLDEQASQTTNNVGLGGSALNGTLGATSSSGEGTDPTWKTKTDCKQNGCLSFDNGDYVTVADNAALRPLSTGYTISAWAKPTAFQAMISNMGNVVVSKYDDSLTQRAYALQFDQTGLVQFVDGGSGCSSGSTTIMNSTVTASAGQWYHLVGVWDGSTMRIYVNGVLSGTPTAKTTTCTTTTAPFAIGARYGNGNPASSRFTGSIDEVKYFNVPLTEDQVRQEYNSGAALNFGSTAADEGSTYFSLPAVAGKWNFEENNGTTANDTSGNQNNAALNNMESADWAQGKVGGALDFDGSNEYANITAGTALQITNNVTVSAWIYPRSNTAAALSKESTGGNFDWQISGTTGNWVCRSGGASGSVDTGIAVALNTWTHITLTYSSSSLNCYVNGLSRGTPDTTPGTLVGNSNAVMLAASPTTPSSYFNGMIDEVSIYNSALTAAQVAYLYNRGEAIGYWKFDECQGNAFNDSSGHSSAAALTVTSTGGNTNLAGSCQTSSSGWGSGASGKRNASFYFDGDGDYATVSDSSNLYHLAGDWSASFWFKTSSAATQIIFTKGANNDWLYAAFVTNNKLYCKTYQANSTAAYLETISAANVNDGNWHHGVCSFSGTTATQYIDGNLSNTSTSISGTRDTASAGLLYIGSFIQASPNSFWVGQLDDLRIFSYGLSASQVKKLYNDNSSVRFGPTNGSP